MRVLILALAFALAPATAAAQGEQRLTIVGVENRPAELSIPGQAYTDTLRARLAATIAMFTEDCPRIVARSIAFGDISNEDVLTRDYVRRGFKVYKERFLIDACGRQFAPNYIVFVKSGEGARIEPTVPGDTLASMKLTYDVQEPTLRVAGTLTQCTTPADIIVLHTAVEQRPTSVRAPWRETWIVSACGRRVDIPVAFTPDNTGVTFNIRGQDAVIAPE